jgi:hypothetical protein
MENELIPIFMKLRVAHDLLCSVVLLECLHLSYLRFSLVRSILSIMVWLAGLGLG